LSKSVGLKIVAIRHIDEFIKADEYFGDFAPYNVGPKEFLKYLQNAEYVCTDSFHCTAFSLQFEKKFITFYRYNNDSLQSRNTRIDSILSITGMTHRVFNGNIFEITNSIDYDAVNEKLELLRDSSNKFLKNSLKVCCQIIR
ncbi:MAG: polysaccharide pyruvyl transferase family protein, partial [Prolixibacteraceae bacterium]